MHKIAVIFIVAADLGACGVISTLVDGVKQARAVGLKPQVGFNWSNGRLVTVTVTFPQLYESQPLRELAGTVRIALAKQFKQTPENVLLAFALGKGNPPTTAQVDVPTPPQPASPDQRHRASPRRT